MNWRRPWQKPFHRCGEDVASSRAALACWYETPLGQELVESESRIIEEYLPTLFGYFLIQLGGGYPGVIQSSRVTHCLRLGIAEDGPLNLIGDAHAMPLLGDSVDVVLLPHILEFSSHPHQVLREVDRVLVPDGHVVIVGFNPWSPWQFWRWMLAWKHRPPWCGRFLGHARLRDWLTLLGFEVVEQQGCFYRLPIQNRGFLSRTAWLERLGRLLPFLAVSYVMVARKRQIRLTPLRLRWRPTTRRVKIAGLVQPFQNSTKRKMHE